MSTMISYIFGSWIGFFTLASLFVNNFIIWVFVRQRIRKAMHGRAPTTRSSAGGSLDVDDEKSGTSPLASSFRSDSYKLDASQNSVSMNEDTRTSQEKRLRLVRSQAILFVASYIASSMITYILRLFESQAFEYVQEMELPYNNYTMMVLQSILLPLQGFFNMMVYIRPKYIRNRNDFPRESRIWALRRAVGGANVEPVHSLDEIDLQRDKKAGFSTPLGNEMVSSLTNASVDAKGEKSNNEFKGSGHSKTILSRASLKSGSLQVIGEISESEGSGSLSVSSRKTMDQYGQSAGTSFSNASASRGILMDGSILLSPKK